MRSSRSDTANTCPKNESEGEVVFDILLMPLHSIYLQFRLRPKLSVRWKISPVVTAPSDKTKHSAVNGSETPRLPVNGLFTSITGKTADSRCPSRAQK